MKETPRKPYHYSIKTWLMRLLFELSSKISSCSNVHLWSRNLLILIVTDQRIHKAKHEVKFVDYEYN